MQKERCRGDRHSAMGIALFQLRVMASTAPFFMSVKVSNSFFLFFLFYLIASYSWQHSYLLSTLEIDPLMFTVNEPVCVPDMRGERRGIDQGFHTEELLIWWGINSTKQGCIQSTVAKICPGTCKRYLLTHVGEGFLEETNPRHFRDEVTRQKMEGCSGQWEQYLEG